MSILIADCGGTKTDIRLLQDEHVSQFQCSGYNALTHPSLQFLDELRLFGELDKKSIKEVHVYAAGLINNDIGVSLREALHQEFPKAVVETNGDLLGAARALCLDQPGIACILGTGSSSCFYNGEKIKNQVPSLGYILGDEGSGASLGKALIRGVWRGELSSRTISRFKKRYPDDLGVMLTTLYQGEVPAQFLAGFSKFIFQNLDDPSVYKMVYSSFEKLFDNVLSQYELQKHMVHFSGSVAFYYSNILRQVANDKHIAVRNILETPIAGLTLFHQKKYDR